MDSSWAAENLQTIRTLMERAALYRRALAPIMFVVGAIGFVAALVSIITGTFQTNQRFAGMWIVTAVICVVATYVLVRRQALKDQEPFWSPPTRRVSQALIPGFLAGGMAGVLAFLCGDQLPGVTWLLALAWVIVYGCALHAAGFFMIRGIKFFGITAVACASVLLMLVAVIPQFQTTKMAHLIMGGWFGVAHLLYGAYLHFTERRSIA